MLPECFMTFLRGIALLKASEILETRDHLFRSFKVHSCKLCNNRYMIASTQITNTEVFTYITVLAFKSSSLGTENTMKTAKK